MCPVLNSTYCLCISLQRQPVLDLFFPLACCVLQDLKTEEILAVGKVIGSLYILDQSCFSFVKSFAIPSCIDTYYINKASVHFEFLCHKRLGHASSMVLQYVHFLENSFVEPFVSCDIYPLSKQHRLPFPRSQSHAGHNFDLIHLDIWGPYKQPSISGAHDALTIVDDYSRATQTFFLCHKYQIVHFGKKISKRFKLSFIFQLKLLELIMKQSLSIKNVRCYFPLWASYIRNLTIVEWCCGKKT